MVTEAASSPVVEAPVVAVETAAPVQEATPVETAALAPVVAEVVPASATPPTPPSPERMQQELEQMHQQRAQELRAREQQVQNQEDNQTLQEYTAQLTAQIASQLEQKYGLAPEQAAEFAAQQATQQAQVIFRGYQQQQAAAAQVQGAQAKVQVATIMSQQYGVPIAALMQYDSPQEMQAAAERTKSEGALRSELEQLRAQVAKLTKGSVPAQSFGTGAVGAGSAGLNEQALVKAVASGQVAMTPEIAARLNKYWAQ